MIILDFNQVAIANLMTSIRGHATEVNENLLRHMILNSIRMNRTKFVGEYGEVVIACDSRNYWRKQLFPYYKASRKKTRDQSGLDWNEIFRVLNKVREELKEYFPYPVLNVETAEADDVIASLCKMYGRDLGGDPILILSGDKDFMQLQKYANVTQYDPIRKRFLKTNNPEKYLLEHILRGDTGDGIPNVLTEDDCFVAGARQRQLRQKSIDEIMSADWPEDWSKADETFVRNYNRNRSLIDLSYIPEDLEEKILEEYNSQLGKQRNKLFNYFIKNKLKHLTECIGEF